MVIKIETIAEKVDVSAHAKIAILGAVGVPGNYGGFETLAENLVRYHHDQALPCDLTVYCSSVSYAEKRSRYLSAMLIYIPFKANGIQSIPYDIVSLLSSILRCRNVLLLLGVPGAIVLPLIRLISKTSIITNIDGIEWRREKWQGIAKRFLRFSEKLAVRYSHELIADNEAIARYVRREYGRDCHVIAYGGDHAVAVDAAVVDEYDLPARYAFSVCRIEPENNVHIVIDAFSRQDEIALVMVGNWNNSEYGRELRTRYVGMAQLDLLDPIYDLGKLKSLRADAALYVHGHSAGGTNPSLVEAMHFGKPILAFDCDFNRATTEGKAIFFKDSASLLHEIQMAGVNDLSSVGKDMLEIAQRRYTWSKVAQQYFDLMLSTT